MVKPTAAETGWRGLPDRRPDSLRARRGRLPLATQLRVRLALILLLLGTAAVAAVVLTARAVREIDRVGEASLRQLGAAYEIDARIDRIAAGAFAYAHDRDSTAFLGRQQNLRELHEWQQHFAAIASDSIEQTGEQTGAPTVSAFVVRLDHAIAAADSSSQRLDAVVDSLASVEQELLLLLEQASASNVDATPAQQARAEAIGQMQPALTRYAVHLRQSLDADTASLGRLDSAAGAFEAAFLRYRRAAQSSGAAQRRSLALRRVFSSYLALADTTITLAEARRVALAEIRTIRDESADYLRASVRQPIEDELSAVVESARSTFRFQLVAASIAVIVLVVVAAIAIERTARHVSRPLSRLVEAARKLEMGDLNQRVVGAPGEVEELSLVFNRMAADLAHIHQELADAMQRAEPASAGASSLVSAMHRAEPAGTGTSSLVSELSYELRQPLTSLREALARMTDPAAKPDAAETSRLVRNALAATDRIVRMLNDGLDLERIEAGQLQLQKRTVEPASVAEESLDRVVSLAGPKRVRLEIAADAPPVSADHERLVQALVRLLEYAIGFSPPEGVVRVSVGNGDGHAEFSVSGCGPLLNHEERERLFEAARCGPHDRRPAQARLGLALARGIVREHGGRIGAESHDGGARIRFTIPLATETQR